MSTTTGFIRTSRGLQRVSISSRSKARTRQMLSTAGRFQSQAKQRLEQAGKDSRAILERQRTVARALANERRLSQRVSQERNRFFRGEKTPPSQSQLERNVLTRFPNLRQSELKKEIVKLSNKGARVRKTSDRSVLVSQAEQNIIKKFGLDQPDKLKVEIKEVRTQRMESTSPSSQSKFRTITDIDYVPVFVLPSGEKISEKEFERRINVLRSVRQESGTLDKPQTRVTTHKVTGHRFPTVIRDTIQKERGRYRETRARARSFELGLSNTLTRPRTTEGSRESRINLGQAPPRIPFAVEDVTKTSGSVAGKLRGAGIGLPSSSFQQQFSKIDTVGFDVEGIAQRVTSRVETGRQERALRSQALESGAKPKDVKLQEKDIAKIRRQEVSNVILEHLKKTTTTTERTTPEGDVVKVLTNPFFKTGKAEVTFKGEALPKELVRPSSQDRTLLLRSQETGEVTKGSTEFDEKKLAKLQIALEGKVSKKLSASIKAQEFTESGAKALPWVVGGQLIGGSAKLLSVTKTGQAFLGTSVGKVATSQLSKQLLSSSFKVGAGVYIAGESQKSVAGALGTGTTFFGGQVSKGSKELFTQSKSGVKNIVYEKPFLQRDIIVKDTGIKGTVTEQFTLKPKGDTVVKQQSLPKFTANTEGKSTLISSKIRDTKTTEPKSLFARLGVKSKTQVSEQTGVTFSTPQGTTGSQGVGVLKSTTKGSKRTVGDVGSKVLDTSSEGEVIFGVGKPRSSRIKKLGSQEILKESASITQDSKTLKVFTGSGATRTPEGLLKTKTRLLFLESPKVSPPKDKGFSSISRGSGTSLAKKFDLPSPTTLSVKQKVGSALGTSRLSQPFSKPRSPSQPRLSTKTRAYNEAQYQRSSQQGSFLSTKPVSGRLSRSGLRHLLPPTSGTFLSQRPATSLISSSALRLDQRNIITTKARTDQKITPVIKPREAQRFTPIQPQQQRLQPLFPPSQPSSGTFTGGGARPRTTFKTPPFFLSAPSLGLGLGGKGVIRPVKRKKRVAPSLVGIEQFRLYGTTGKLKQRFTGLEVRPVQGNPFKKRRRK